MVKFLPTLQLKALWIFLTALLFLIVAGVGTLFYPTNILSVREPFEILTPVVKPGEVLWFKLVYTKNFAISGVVTTWLEGEHGEYILLPNEDSAAVSNVPMTRGEEKVKIGERKIPDYVPRGKYNVLWIARYDPWKWKSLTYAFRSQCLEVR
jgi:hypothetical protein